MSASRPEPSREETLAALLQDPDVARGFREAERAIATEARAGGDRFVRLASATPAARPATPGRTHPPRRVASPSPLPTRSTLPPGVPGLAAEVITLPRRTNK